MNKEIIEKINELKRKRNAVILAHNYQPAEVQDIADYLGDSLGLSIQAAKTSADVIVFCGVHFMAETAAILCPDKKVLMPDHNAGCPMADMIEPEGLEKLKAQNPRSQVVCYVNSSAEIKAMSDICCTSANSVKVCQSIKDTDEIIFVPDKYLGLYTSTQVKDKKFILWQGYCPTHAKILPEHIKKAKKEHPKAVAMVHPECRPETIAEADEVLSTGGMETFARKSRHTEFIVGTEVGMLHRLRKENPDKKFYPALETATCPNMKKTSLEKILWSLQDIETIVRVPEDIANKARISIERMLEIGRQD
ncbi:MAG: quinolinate synthase NadA [Candidatus Margulisiibacteriota bacterium]